MKKALMKYFSIFLLLVFYSSLLAQIDSESVLIKNELQREYSILSKQKIPVYYLSYTFYKDKKVTLEYINGTKIPNENTEIEKIWDIIGINLKVGAPELDQSRELNNRNSFRDRSLVYTIMKLPQRALNDIWLTTHQIYEKAIEKYNKVLVDRSNQNEITNKIPDFIINHTPNQFYEDSIENQFEKLNQWEIILKQLSSLANFEKEQIRVSARLENKISRKYFFSSQGDEIVQNTPIFLLDLGVYILDDDGEELPVYDRFVMSRYEDFPSEKELTSKVLMMIDLAKKIKVAPLAEAYSGPAIMSGNASGVYFHEILGHRLESHRIKEKKDAQTLKNKLGEKIVPDFLSIHFDPTINEHTGIKLIGGYKYDDEGTKSQKVEVIKKGILCDYLRSRSPLDATSLSNGHGRAGEGQVPVSRQSNMIISSSEHVEEKELRSRLIQKLKLDKKQFGYLIKQVTGGYTSTYVYQPNFFEVQANIAYKVYADGRPDELVKGVRMVGTPLLMLSQIECTGGAIEQFAGFCGAESGYVPVSTISPMFLFKNIEIQRPIDKEKKPRILISPKKIKNNNAKV
jgi:TldD protein